MKNPVSLFPFFVMILFFTACAGHPIQESQDASVSSLSKKQEADNKMSKSGEYHSKSCPEIDQEMNSQLDLEHNLYVAKELIGVLNKTGRVTVKPIFYEIDIPKKGLKNAIKYADAGCCDDASLYAYLVKSKLPPVYRQFIISYNDMADIINIEFNELYQAISEIETKVKEHKYNGSCR